MELNWNWQLANFLTFYLLNDVTLRGSHGLQSHSQHKGTVLINIIECPKLELHGALITIQRLICVTKKCSIYFTAATFK